MRGDFRSFCFSYHHWLIMRTMRHLETTQLTSMSWAMCWLRRCKNKASLDGAEQQVARVIGGILPP